MNLASPAEISRQRHLSVVDVIDSLCRQPPLWSGRVKLSRESLSDSPSAGEPNEEIAREAILVTANLIPHTFSDQHYKEWIRAATMGYPRGRRTHVSPEPMKGLGAD